MDFHSYPFPPNTSPLFACNGVVARPTTGAQAGLTMLQRGGNAVDAAATTNLDRGGTNCQRYQRRRLPWSGWHAPAWFKCFDALRLRCKPDIRAQSYRNARKRLAARYSSARQPRGDLHGRFSRLALAEIMASAIAPKRVNGVTPVTACGGSGG
jgi:hypothetical protein